MEASKAQPKSPTTPEATPVTPPPRSPRVSGAGSPSASGNVQVMFFNTFEGVDIADNPEIVIVKTMNYQ